LEAKILSVADVFDALTSPRDYPKYDETGKTLECERMSVSQAVTIIEEGTGSHFDAAVVAALKKCLPHPEFP
jgi:HD-GYP domain-containing protein (c-di-GMP phosphodiesterase class II)